MNALKQQNNSSESELVAASAAAVQFLAAVAARAARTQHPDPVSVAGEIATAFATAYDEDPASATPELLVALVQELLPTQPPAPLRLEPPAVFTETLLAACFRSAALSSESCQKLGVQPVLFRGLNGAQVRGLSLAMHLAIPPEERPVLLETGELALPYDPSAVVWLDEATALADIPASVLAYLHIGGPMFEKFSWVTAEIRSLKAAKKLGQFTVPVDLRWLSETEAQLCASVVDAGHEAAKIGVTGATGAAGAVVNVPVDDELTARIEVNVAATGPYAVAQLLRAGAPVLRLDRPRENSFRGLYLFPVLDEAQRVQRVVAIGAL